MELMFATWVMQTLSNESSTLLSAQNVNKRKLDQNALNSRANIGVRNN